MENHTVSPMTGKNNKHTKFARDAAGNEEKMYMTATTI